MSLKNGTKFTGRFASLVIKLKITLVLKVQTRAKLAQKMMPIKNKQFCTIKKKHDDHIYAVIKRLYLSHSGFVGPHVLGHMMYECIMYRIYFKFILFPF